MHIVPNEFDWSACHSLTPGLILIKFDPETKLALSKFVLSSLQGVEVCVAHLEKHSPIGFDHFSFLLQFGDQCRLVIAGHID